MCDFIETRLFTSLAERYLPDHALHRLQIELIRNPLAGPVIPGTGGVRKLRWPRSGSGKRSGLRIVYYVKPGDNVIWLLTLYPKSQKARIAANVLRQIREEIENA